MTFDPHIRFLSIYLLIFSANSISIYQLQNFVYYVNLSRNAQTDKPNILHVNSATHLKFACLSENNLMSKNLNFQGCNSNGERNLQNFAKELISNT